MEPGIYYFRYFDTEYLLKPFPFTSFLNKKKPLAASVTGIFPIMLVVACGLVVLGAV
jgi:hypothetical protein